MSHVRVAAIATILLSPSPSIALAQEDLAGSEWGYTGSDAPFVRFEADGQLFGHGGCNRFFGSYTAGEGGKLEIGPLGATRMACPQEIMNKEMAFMAMLGTTASYIRRGIELDLKDGAGVIAATLTQRDAD